MSKKAFCITALWLSNIVLLVHITLPHHHHEDATICFSHSHHQQQSNNPHPEKCCFIDQMYITEGNHSKNICRSHNNCTCESTNYALIPTILRIPDPIDEPFIDFGTDSYILLFYLDLIAQSNGWRAPPVC